MFMDWRNQYSENEYTTQSNLQIQCNPYQATSGIFHRTRTNNFKICMEIQKTLNSQRNLEKEEWNWRNQLAWLQALLQSHSHQDSMVFSQRQKYRSMGKKIESPEINPYTSPWRKSLAKKTQEPLSIPFPLKERNMELHKCNSSLLQGWFYYPWKTAFSIQRQKYRSMEQNRKPRDKSTHIWTPYLWQRRQEYTME